MNHERTPCYAIVLRTHTILARQQCRRRVAIKKRAKLLKTCRCSSKLAGTRLTGGLQRPTPSQSEHQHPLAVSNAITITKKSLPPPRIILDSESSHNNLKPQLATIKAPLPGMPLDDWPPQMPQDSRGGKRPPGTNEIRKPDLDIYSLMAAMYNAYGPQIGLPGRISAGF